MRANRIWKQRPGKAKGLLTALLKIIIAVALLSALIYSGRLSFTKLRIFVDQPMALITNAGVWLSAGIFLAAARWWLLLRGMGVRLVYGRLVAMQMIGAFFTLALPGTFGGDAARVLYGAREQDGEQAGTVVLSILIDRICGLSGLFFAGGLAIGWQAAWNKAELQPFVVYVYGGCALIIVALGGVLWLPSRWFTRPAAWISGQRSWLSWVQRLVGAFLNFQKHRLHLIGAVALAVLMQLVILMYYCYLARLLNGPEVSFAAITAIAPLAMLITAVPMAPGGFGIGHVAFDRLLAMGGIGEGADIYNAALIGQMAMSLLGVVPYFMLRRAKPTL